MPLTQDDLNKHWHLDKRVPLALIVTLAIQGGAIFWWAAVTTTRLEAVERSLAYSAPQADRLTRVETKVDNIVDTLAEIKATLRKSN